MESEDLISTKEAHSGEHAREQLSPLGDKVSPRNKLSLRDKLSLILDVGQLMMENGADSKRIVRDMLRCAAYLGIYWEDVQIHIAYSTIMVNVDTKKETATMFRKCYKHGVNMNTILEVSGLSWQALQDDAPYEEFKARLAAIQKDAGNRWYSRRETFLAIGLASASFCLLFGGEWYEAFFTFIAAICGALVRSLIEKYEMNGYVGIAASAFTSTLVAYLAVFVSGLPSPWLPMVACALTLIPGIPLINAVDDFLNNYLTSGMTRITHTILIMLAMTFGISATVSITKIPSFISVNIMPESLYMAQAVAAAMAAFGFTIMFNVPRHFIAAACLGAVVTVNIRNILMIDLHVGMAFASFLGAATLSVLLFALSKKFHEPVFVVTIPAIIPMVPGVLLYRFLFGIIGISGQTYEQLLTTARNGVEAMLILLGIAVGATVPEVLAHQYIERSKEKRLEKLLEKRHGTVVRKKKAAEIDRASNRN